MGKLVNVIFRQEDPKEYAYRTNEELKAGQMVVVETRHGFSLATVSAMIDTLPDHLGWDELKEVVTKVDLTAYNVRKEKADRRRALLAQMDQKCSEIKNLAIYRALAAEDDEMKKLLDEFSALS